MLLQTKTLKNLNNHLCKHILFLVIRIWQTYISTDFKKKFKEIQCFFLKKRDNIASWFPLIYYAIQAFAMPEKVLTEACLLKI